MFNTIVFDITLDKLKVKTFVELIPVGSTHPSPYYAIVDTGSSDTAMSEQLFNELGYKEQEKIPTTITGINGKSKGFSTIIDDFILGDVNLGKTRITVSKFEPEFENIIILGMNILAWFNMLVSYSKGEIILAERKIKNIDENSEKFKLPASNVIITAEFELIEIPEFHEATINLDFTGGGFEQYTATVNGTLTTFQWDGLAEKIEIAIQNGFNTSSVVRKGRFYMVFGQNMSVIVLEKNPVFDKWSVRNKYLIHFNYNYLVGLSDDELVINLIEAILEMDTTNLPF
jgi:hypothetical protein